MQLLRRNPAFQVQLPFPGDVVEDLLNQRLHQNLLPTASVAITANELVVAQLFLRVRAELLPQALSCLDDQQCRCEGLFNPTGWGGGY